MTGAYRSGYGICDMDDVLRSHLAKIGRKGGKAGTDEQKTARSLNLYRAMAIKHPTSVKVRQELTRLEKKQETSR